MLEDKKESITEEPKKDEDIVYAFWVVYNRKENKYGVIGSPGFFDDKIRAFGVLKEVEKQLEEFFEKQKRIDQRIITTTKNIVNRINFNNFLKGKH